MYILVKMEKYISKYKLENAKSTQCRLYQSSLLKTKNMQNPTLWELKCKYVYRYKKKQLWKDGKICRD